MVTPAQGYAAALAMDDALPFDGSSVAFEFLSSTLKKSATQVNTNGIRGERSRLEHRTRIVQEAVSGSLTMNPSVTELDILWPRILGGTTSAGVTDVADTLPEFQVMIDKVSKVHTYAGCRVSRATISGSAGQPIQLVLDIEAETESEGNAGTFPSITIDTDGMFVFSDVTLTIDSTAREVQSFSLVIDNLVDTGRYINSTTRSEIAAQDRQVTLDCVFPYTATNADLYDIAIAGVDGALAISDGSTTYTFDFGDMKAAAQGPDVGGKSEILLPVTFDCYKTGSDSEVKVTKS